MSSAWLPTRHQVPSDQAPNKENCSFQELLVRKCFWVNKVSDQNVIFCWAPVAHTCNPSCSEGRDKEDHSLKTAWANSLWDPTSKKPFTQKGWWSGSKSRLWVQTPVLPKKKKKSIMLLGGRYSSVGGHAQGPGFIHSAMQTNTSFQRKKYFHMCKQWGVS
jgi:hypothetical protein